MKQTLTFFLFILALCASGQEKVDLDSVGNYNGKVVEVNGKVVKISSVGQGRNQKIIIYLGGQSPNEKLAVILDNGEPAGQHYLLKNQKFERCVIIVTGKIQMKKGKARIELKDDKNIRFIVDEEVEEL